MNGRMDEWINECVCVCKYTRFNNELNEWRINVWMNGWMNEQMNVVCTCLHERTTECLEPWRTNIQMNIYEWMNGLNEWIHFSLSVLIFNLEKVKVIIILRLLKPRQKFPFLSNLSASLTSYEIFEQENILEVYTFKLGLLMLI